VEVLPAHKGRTAFTLRYLTKPRAKAALITDIHVVQQELLELLADAR
jgi:hypothetical protein